VRLIGEPVDFGIAGPVVLAIDQGRDQDAAAIFSEARGVELGCLFGCLVGVRDSNRKASWRLLRFDEKAVSVDVFKDGPADVVDLVAGGSGEGGALVEFD